jgi:undecaprenyl-diphosphatase
LLAHWTSDVATGFAVGALIERLLRPLTLRSRDRPGTQ